MSYGGWEVVGKNKKEKSTGKQTKLSKAEKKKFMENAPKLEDFRKSVCVRFEIPKPFPPPPRTAFSYFLTFFKQMLAILYY